MKNLLKRPPIAMKKKVTWSDPPLVVKKKSFEVTRHWWRKKNDLKWPPLGVKKNHFNWSPLGWNNPPSAMKRKWLKLPHLTQKISFKSPEGCEKTFHLRGPIAKFSFTWIDPINWRKKRFTWLDPPTWTASGWQLRLFFYKQYPM
jgi:hypothetical protein